MATEAAGMDAATTKVEGVRVTAQPGQWPGDVPISREVLPIEVTIQNDSDKPLRLTYDQFTLEGADGRTLGAMPPFEISGDVQDPVLARRYGTIVRPEFGFDRSFLVAPYYADVYPSLGVVEGPWDYDPFYFERHYGFWRRADLPTPEMLSRALPEGELRPGGEVTGFLFFQPLRDEIDDVTFRAELVNAANRYRFAVASIPFVTENGAA